jgi:DNA-directed RNA polymerases I, II, and III subunit RPABC2
MTSPVISAMMSKYEKAKIIGSRMEQLGRGAKPTIDIKGMTNIRDIAVKELEEKTIPFKIVRTKPNGEKVIWDIKDMII